jgi:flagellar basal-body rod protein FlgC
MPFGDLFTASRISGSGMSAERLRMEVIANNIANAHSTKSANGGPFRRQDVVFAEVLAEQTGKSGAGLGGVMAVDIVEDPSE